MSIIIYRLTIKTKVQSKSTEVQSDMVRLLWRHMG